MIALTYSAGAHSMPLKTEADGKPERVAHGQPDSGPDLQPEHWEQLWLSVRLCIRVG